MKKIIIFAVCLFLLTQVFPVLEMSHAKNQMAGSIHGEGQVLGNELLGRTRLGFLDPYGYPKFSPKLTKLLFDSLGVKGYDEYKDELTKHLDELAPTFYRQDFFMWAPSFEWKDAAKKIALENSKGIEHIITLNFRSFLPNNARTVGDIVEYYDGDGKDDNPFGAVVKIWQIENEINMKDIFWKGTLLEYTKHLLDCYNEAKNSDPSCVVVMAGEASDAENKVYADILRELGGQPAFDAVDIHIYGQATDSLMVERCSKNFRERLLDAGYDPNTPMFMTEYGTYCGKMPKMDDSSETIQAKTFAERIILALANGIKGICYISCVDGVMDDKVDGYFSQMGLIHNGITKFGNGPWHKRKVFWTYKLLSLYLSQVTFDDILEVTLGVGIRAFRFNRPGLQPVYFVFLSNQETARKVPLPVTEKMRVTSLVPIGESGDEYDKLDGAIETKIIDPTDLNGIYAMLAKGPIAVEPLPSRTLSEKIGIAKLSASTDIDLPVGEVYLAKENAIKWVDGGKPDFSKTDLAITKLVKAGKSAILAINVEAECFSKPVESAKFLKFVAAVVERYDGDGILDAPGTLCTKFHLDARISDTSYISESSKCYAQMIKTSGRAVVSASASTKLIVGGFSDNKARIWPAIFNELRKFQAEAGYPFFDIMAISNNFGSSRADSENYNFINRISRSTRKLLDENGLQRIPITCLSAMNYVGVAKDYPEQTERDQANELVKRIMTMIGNGCQTACWGMEKDVSSNIFGSCGLLDLNGNPRLSYYSMQKLLLETSKVQVLPYNLPGGKTTIGRWIAPEYNSLWGMRFGINDPFVIAWVNGSKPPTFSYVDFDFPATQALELEYLVPDQKSGKETGGKPTFKKVTVFRQDGEFKIPVDRLEPFIIRPSNATAPKVEIKIDPAVMTVNPGQKDTATIIVTGFEGEAILSAPSTKTLGTTISPEKVKSGQEATLTVSTLVASAGQQYTVAVSATTGQGSAEALLQIEVSNTMPVEISLWIGKKEAQVGGQKKQLAEPPTIIQGYTVVPVRFISETFGAKVGYDQKTKEITLTFGLKPDGSYTKKVTLWVGKKEATSDFGSMLPAFQTFELPVAPVIINGTTMVPLRFVSEVLGADVEWNSKERRVDIKWWPA